MHFDFRWNRSPGVVCQHGAHILDDATKALQLSFFSNGFQAPDCRKDSGLSPLDGGGASSRRILLIERLTDQRLDDRLSTDVQLLGSPVQFIQHARREVHIHPLDWTHHAPLVGEEP